MIIKKRILPVDIHVFVPASEIAMQDTTPAIPKFIFTVCINTTIALIWGKIFDRVVEPLSVIPGIYGPGNFIAPAGCLDSLQNLYPCFYEVKHHFFQALLPGVALDHILVDAGLADTPLKEASRFGICYFANVTLGMMPILYNPQLALAQVAYQTSAVALRYLAKKVTNLFS